MKAKLIIEGKEFEIEMSNEALKVLGVKRTGYERVAQGEKYYYVDCEDAVDSVSEDNLDSDEASYDCANYYSDEIVAENNARADRLMRQLRRFAVEHREKEIKLENSPYFISYNPSNNEFKALTTAGMVDFGAIFFESQWDAELAINVFYDELIWYFTEYKDSL